MTPQGLYTLTSYGKTLERKMEAVSNNLANVDTTGYKGDHPAFRQLFAKSMGVASQSDEERFAHHEHIAPYSGVGTFYVGTAAMGKDFAQGDLRNTGNDLDFALATQDGFFSVRTPQGERFTRAGNFRLNQDSTLVTGEGFPVNGKDGEPLRIEGDDVALAEDGSVIVDGQPAGGVRVVNFPFPERLQKEGGSLFAPVDQENSPRIKEDVRMVQGMLEASNVDAVSEMTRMIEANRAYTRMMKAMTTNDQINQQAITLAEVRG